MLNDYYFNAEVIKDSLFLLRSGAKGTGVVYKMATGKLKPKLKRRSVLLINALLTTILIGLPLLFIYLWLRK